jgi:hypothetical protein
MAMARINRTHMNMMKSSEYKHSRSKIVTIKVKLKSEKRARVKEEKNN